jgi:hypothetical protein
MTSPRETARDHQMVPEDDQIVPEDDQIVPEELTSVPAGAIVSSLTLLSRGVAHVIDQGLAWSCSTGWSPFLWW